jgi:hypothetical protein
MPQDKSSQSSGRNRQTSPGSGRSSGEGWRSNSSDQQTQRDSQQIADDNQQAGIGDVEQTRNRASDMEPAEGSRETAGGISNRPLDEEQDNQARVPPRGENKEGGHA